MKILRSTMRETVILGLALLLAVPVVAAEKPDRVQKAVSRAIEKGKELLKAGKGEAALEKFNEARIVSNDQAPAAFVGLAEVELAWSNLERALQHADKALELTNSQASRAEILNLKGIIFLRYVEMPVLKALETNSRPPESEGGQVEATPAGAAKPEPHASTASRRDAFFSMYAAQAKLAETHFLEALELSGGTLNAARLNLAEALEWQGSREESREWVAEYLKHAANDDERAVASSLQCWLREPMPVALNREESSERYTQPERLSEPVPEYNLRARKNRTQGVVIAQVIIEENGNVGCVKVLKGLPDGLSEATAEAMKKWKFKPATLDGKPIRVYYNLTTSFSLGG